MRRIAVLCLLLAFVAVAVPSVLRSPTRAQDATPMAADNETLAQRYIDDLLNQADDAAVDELLTEDFVLHLNAGTIPGRDGFRAFLAGLHEGFPDVHYTSEDIVSSGDRVAVRWVVNGTHQGVFNGIPATGLPIVDVPGISLLRISNGQIAEIWVVVDTFGLLQQIGVIPAPGAPEGGTPEA
jgi:steroid delta-isomerase-like uncharacterized protein